MTTKQLPPELKPFIWCLNCGGGEMRRTKDAVLCRLNTRMYGGFGGWYIKCDDEPVYFGDSDLDWKKYPTLMRFELMARKKRGDWRAILRLPLRDADYQRQGKNRWVLVRTGRGFA